MSTHSSKDEALEMWATGISLCHHIFADLQVSLAIFQLGSVFTEGSGSAFAPTGGSLSPADLRLLVFVVAVGHSVVDV